jgi:hypothetical protein
VAHPGLGGEQFDQGCVQSVDPAGRISGHGVQGYQHPFGINNQID